MYRCVVEICWWPASSWMAFVEAPAIASREQNVCLKMWMPPVTFSCPSSRRRWRKVTGIAAKAPTSPRSARALALEECAPAA